MSSLRRSSLMRVCAGMAAFALSALLSLALVSCGDDKSPTGNDKTPDNRAPAVPAIDTASGAPADAATGVAQSVVLHWTCSDPDGDDLTYDVRFGTDAAPQTVSTDQSATSLARAPLAVSTEYFWQVAASDPDGETATSPVWSFTTAAQAVETVSTPSVATGPATGFTGDNLTFTATGSASSFNAAVQYRFDWGDGVMSTWSAATRGSVNASHSWDDAGSYEIKVQARSTRTPALESVWSDAKMVVIEAPAETIILTTNVHGPDNLAAGVVGDFDFIGFVRSSEGHDTEWRWVWGDGEFSDWITVREGSHAYDAAGTYDVGIQGRCIEHPSATHERLVLHTVEVAASETISTPTRISGISSSETSQFEHYISSDATSSFGHDIELRYDFGDGDISDWYPRYERIPHGWDLGTYSVTAQARCVEHPEIVSEWGGRVTCTFEEVILGLSDVPSGPETGIVGVPVEFTMDECTSNEGHAVEYNYRYRRATTYDYVYTEFGPSTTQTITWDTPGTYYVKGRAQCALHPDVGWYTRNYVRIVISAAP